MTLNKIIHSKMTLRTFYYAQLNHIHEYNTQHYWTLHHDTQYSDNKHQIYFKNDTCFTVTLSVISLSDVGLSVVAPFLSRPGMEMDSKGNLGFAEIHQLIKMTNRHWNGILWHLLTFSPKEINLLLYVYYPFMLRVSSSMKKNWQTFILPSLMSILFNVSKSMKRFVPQEIFCLKSIQEGKYNFLNILKITASNSNLFCLSHSASLVHYFNSSMYVY